MEATLQLKRTKACRRAAERRAPAGAMLALPGDAGLTQHLSFLSFRLEKLALSRLVYHSYIRNVWGGSPLYHTLFWYISRTLPAHWYIFV